MRRALFLSAVAVLAAAAGGWALSAPRTLDPGALPDHEPDPANGERMFFAGGCASCHATPGARDDDVFVLSGGLELDSDFGTFRVPNISSDPEHGIGAWSALDLANAMVLGTAPDGRHYYPAFPYTSYRHMRLEDIIDLKAFLDTLPASDNTVSDHDLPFPYSVSRGIGFWKMRYLDGEPFEPDPEAGETVNLGAYLVTGPGHCAECHTPRDSFGGLDRSRDLAGAPSPEGDGFVPNITPHEDGIAEWSESEIAYALESGFTPSFDSFGGRMAAVQRNLARLPAEDREAIAAYLKTVEPLATTSRP